MCKYCKIKSKKMWWYSIHTRRYSSHLSWKIFRMKNSPLHSRRGGGGKATPGEWVHAQSVCLSVYEWVRDGRELLASFSNSPCLSYWACDYPPKSSRFRQQFSENLISQPIAYSMAKLVNNLFEIGHFPDLWKIAHITAIYKRSGPKTSKTNFRPISILPTLSKIF